MTDVFVSLFLLWLFSIFLKQRNRKLLLLLAVTGVISHFSVKYFCTYFIYTGVYWMVHDIFQKKRIMQNMLSY